MNDLTPSLEIEIEDDFKAYILKEDKEPIIHFFGSKVIELSCSVYLDKPKWANNLEGEKVYDDIEFLYDFLSRYELARRLWNINHETSLPKMDIPDYMKLSA